MKWLGFAGVVVGAIVIGALAYPYLWSDDAPVWPRDLPACDGFDFPVGPPDAVGYYDARPFRVDDHLGNDWNGNGGNDTDLGDPVFAASSGIVVEAVDIGHDWGNIVRIVHGCGIESLYAHLDRIETSAGAIIKRGQQIGTIGTAGGRYKAHLHFELRDRPLPLGGGYADETPPGYLDPTAYIRAHRPSQQR
ncbi:MAG: M23 family metallopeptidase [Deltaproteobacteria bacterium]|nr:M23 family metallopeptidase [Deltaproteobacteria bacterium]